MATDSASALAPPPVTLLDEPLEYIAADHVRQRTFCSLLRQIGEKQSTSENEIGPLIAYMNHDLVLHHCDEEDDLFPALEYRAKAEDNLDALLRRLRRDHRLSEPLASEIIGVLARPGAIGDRGKLFVDFAAREYEHLAIENSIVLPIARVRLKRQDLLALSAGMKARRGVLVP